MKTIHVMAGMSQEPSQVVAGNSCSVPPTDEDKKLMKEHGIALARWMRNNIAAGVYDQCLAILVSSEATRHPELEAAAAHFRRNT